MSAAAVPTKAPAHLPGLDGLRGIAILAVLMHHFMTPNYPSGIPGGLHGILVKCVYRVFDVGWWGVDLFFVLSGFLITGILLDAKGSAHYFRNFYARRSLRIFPLYYGVLLALFVGLPLLAGDPTPGGFYAFSRSIAPYQAWLWLYGANIKTAMDATGWTFGILTHFWSLAVEEHFYLVWPLVVSWCDPKALVRVCLFVAAGSALSRVAFLAGGMAPAYVFVLTPCRLDGLALGSLVATLGRLRGGVRALVPQALKILKIAGPVTLGMLLIVNRFNVAFVVIGHLLLAVSWSAVLPFAALGTAPAILAAPALRFCGKYSYGIYVLHPFVFAPVDGLLNSPAMKRLTGGSYEAYAVSRCALCLLGALAMAFASWHLYEKHFLRLKRFFPAAHTSARGDAPVLISHAALD